MVCVLLIAPVIEAKTVSLSWDPSPTPTVTGYKVHSSQQEDMSNPTIIDVGDVLTYTIPNLEDSIEHWFCVIAYDGNGNESVCSNVVKSPAVALPGTIQNFQWRLEP